MIHDVYCRFGCKQLICSHRRWGRVVVVVGGVVELGDELALHAAVCFVIDSRKHYSCGQTKSTNLSNQFWKLAQTLGDPQKHQNMYNRAQ